MRKMWPQTSEATSCSSGESQTLTGTDDLHEQKSEKVRKDQDTLITAKYITVRAIKTTKHLHYIKRFF